MAAISVDTLKARLAERGGVWPLRGWALFDVREAGEADAGHIPSATFLPRRQIEFRVRDLVPATGTQIVVYGGDDDRARRAARTLNALGYEHVDWLEGGMPAWREAGGAVAQGSNVPCKDFGEKVLVSERIPYVTPQALKDRIDRGERIVICDVRTPEEHKAGCIPDGHSAPSFELALHGRDLRSGYDTVVVNCAGRTRSIIGTSTLHMIGLDSAVALENGTMGWRLASYELERGATRRLPAPSVESVVAARQAAQRLADGAGVRQAGAGYVANLLAARAARNAYVFDVRPLESYSAGHISGAVALPGGQAVQRADDFVAVPEGEIVFVDDGDARALLTAYWYRRMGFPNVSVLSGGMPAWNAAGRSIETGRGRSEAAGLAAARRVVQVVTADALMQVLKARDACIVIDVGTSRQFAQGHLPGAHWVPRGWLEDRIAGLASGKRVVVTAADPAQAVLAGATLVAMGYGDVRVLESGTSAWKAQGGQVEMGLPEGMASPGDLVEPPYAKGREAMLRYLEWETKLGHKYEASQEGSERRHGLDGAL